ncbi:MAG TPA: imidazolonepropionase, partial [Terriglobia bacterium]|nr:imidazolonepropionase [Terriglobia bacterium]
MRPPRSKPLFFSHAKQLLTLAGLPVPRRGEDLRHLGLIADGAVLIDGPEIRAVGSTTQLAGEARRLKAREIDCHGRVIMPG